MPYQGPNRRGLLKKKKKKLVLRLYVVSILKTSTHFCYTWSNHAMYHFGPNSAHFTCASKVKLTAMGLFACVRKAGFDIHFSSKKLLSPALSSYGLFEPYPSN